MSPPLVFNLSLLRLDPNATTTYEGRAPLELASDLKCFKILADAGGKSTNPPVSLLILLLQVAGGKTNAGQEFQEKISSLSSEEKEEVNILLNTSKCFR